MKQNDELREFIQKYAEDISPKGKWKQVIFFLGSYIPQKKLKNASAAYANMTDNEEPLLLIDCTLLGSAKEGLLLTTSHLYYNVSLKLDSKPEQGQIPISEISSIFFENVKRKEIGKISFTGTLLYINSKPFAYLLFSSENETKLLNDIFGKLNSAVHTDTTLASRQKPVWAFDGEELIHELSSKEVRVYSPDINTEYCSLFITNARIVKITPNNAQVRAAYTYSPELFFNHIELIEVINIIIKDEGFGKSTLKLELFGGAQALFTAKTGIIKELDKYLKEALKKVIPVVLLEDPDEEFLFKEPDKSSYFNAFCTEEFWAKIIGSTQLKARFCITNKRILYYRIDNIAALSDTSLKYALRKPILSQISLPLSCIKAVIKENKNLSGSTHLHLNCVPLGIFCQSLSIPATDDKVNEIQYDTAMNKDANGMYIARFSQLERYKKQQSQEIAEILSRLLPDIYVKQI